MNACRAPIAPLVFGAGARRLNTRALLQRPRCWSVRASAAVQLIGRHTGWQNSARLSKRRNFPYRGCRSQYWTLRAIDDSGANSTCASDVAPTVVAEPTNPGRVEDEEDGVQSFITSDRTWAGLMLFLALGGAADTAYLTAVKLSAVPLLCTTPGGGCESVLSSSYASFYGIPLPLVGVLTYMSTAWAIAASAKKQTETSINALLGLTSVLFTASLFLLHVLLYELKQDCIYCYTSAAISFTLFGIAWSSALSDRRTLRGRIWLVALPLATSALLTVANGAESAPPTQQQQVLKPCAMIQEKAPSILPYEKKIVSTDSTEAAVRVAKRLTDAGARFYGAFWCSHCNEQKETFGTASR
eukprot:scaffold1504_cov417-Prasinococcus_capsulatus_cf.AAC.62